MALQRGYLLLVATVLVGTCCLGFAGYSASSWRDCVHTAQTEEIISHRNTTNTSYNSEVQRWRETCNALGVAADVVAKSRTVGNTARWQRAIKAAEGGGRRVKVAVIGGSLPAGHGCAPDQGNVPNHTCAWPNQLQTMLRSRWNNVDISNLARGGTASTTGITQMLQLKEYDIVIINWTINDHNVKQFFNNEPEAIKEHFETLVRTAMALPKSPAVLLFEDFGWAPLGESQPIAELMHYAVAAVYDLPIISARAGMWWEKNLHEEIMHLAKDVHVKEIWHTRFACLMLESWIQESESVWDMSLNTLDAADRPPVYGGSTLKCSLSFEASAYSDTLENATSDNTGWAYEEDVPGKFGFISRTPGATLSFDVPTKVATTSNKLLIHYLRSYTPEWGTAQVNASCMAKLGRLIDSRTDVHESQLAEMEIELEGSDAPCSVAITNTRDKVKIVEVFVYNCN